MKQTILIATFVALLLVAGNGLVSAWGGGLGGGNEDCRALDVIEFDPERQAEVDAHLADYHQQLSDLREQSQALRAEGQMEAAREMRADFFALQEEFRTEIGELLTEEELELLRGRCDGPQHTRTFKNTQQQNQLHRQHRTR